MGSARFVTLSATFAHCAIRGGQTGVSPSTRPRGKGRRPCPTFAFGSSAAAARSCCPRRCCCWGPRPGGPTGSEDCLYLNVTAPAGRAAGGRPRPVMVWFHGGGFFSGAGDAYRPDRLALRGDAVVVTMNYRLGVFGLFGHPELGGAPDFALADQRAALRWVRANAPGFGADPGNVTVFGESAGALSVCAHLTSPASAGLFHRAIVQSGSCSTTAPPRSLLPELGTYDRAADRAAATARGPDGGLLDRFRPHRRSGGGGCPRVAARPERGVGAVAGAGGGGDPYGGRAGRAPLRALGRAVARARAHQDSVMISPSSGIRSVTVPVSP
ncbi:carboxylesterase family protein [Streptomyces sp. NPDC097617]|uniref:carboxylesterase family protein n=1 Tax=Streptomyces sp. NPDC097617 TaxID=3366091 RepID=UPI00381A9C24